jgi:hypothetical protein
VPRSPRNFGARTPVKVGTMPIRTLLLLTLALAAAGAAAALPAGAQQGFPNTPDPSITDGSAQRALDKARARWDKLKLRDYDYELMQVCFCPSRGWSLVKVRDGRPTKSSQAKAGDLATVPRLFREVRRAIKLPVHRLNVKYSSTRGVPVEVSTDPIEGAVDDEGGFVVRRFKRR